MTMKNINNASLSVFVMELCCKSHVQWSWHGFIGYLFSKNERLSRLLRMRGTTLPRFLLCPARAFVFGEQNTPTHIIHQLTEYTNSQNTPTHINTPTHRIHQLT